MHMMWGVAAALLTARAAPAGRCVVLGGVGIPQQGLADAVALAALVAVLEREVHGERRLGVHARLFGLFRRRFLDGRRGGPAARASSKNE